jgi:hypothetical protein
MLLRDATACSSFRAAFGARAPRVLFKTETALSLRAPFPYQSSSSGQ